MAWVLDLDGVIWLADDPIPGSSQAVARLRAAGEAVAFVTNNSYSPRAEVAAKLARHGIDAAEDVVTSAMAAAGLVAPGSRALVCGGPGVTEALRAGDVETLDAADPSSQGAPVDVVVVGYHRQFDYERLTVAATAVRRGRASSAPTTTPPTRPPTARSREAGRSSPRWPPRAASRQRWRASPTSRWRPSCAPTSAPTAWWWGTAPRPMGASR